MSLLVARGVPRHKTVPGTRCVVDAFRFANCDASAFFLTHAHSDHYGGLSAVWTRGPIYCTAITARVAALKTGVDASLFRELQLDTPAVVEEEEGVTVTAVDANHCPGAVMLFFETPQGRVLHSGDCRASSSMQQNPVLQRARARGLELLFLDTTYCHQ
jgi:DNA cross-link repair 1A protein